LDTLRDQNTLETHGGANSEDLGAEWALGSSLRFGEWV